MDDIGKVYRPEEIEETPFPQQGQSDLSVSNPSSSVGGAQGFSPAQTKEQSFPAIKRATELLSTALNTRSKKIMQNLEFTPSGSIQVGVYTQGVNGDIRISPLGIVARNSLGSETFALDGESGDAVFAGQIQTGAVIAGVVLLGDGSIEIDGIQRRMIFYDETTNLPVIVIGNV